MTKVSILIPCYNAQQWVAEAVESALNQTYDDCEVICIDDGSTDLTLPPEPTPVGMLQCPAGVPEQEAGHAQKTIYPRTDYSEPA